MQVIYLAGGCFWCIASAYNGIKGIRVRSGYAGGSEINPSYLDVKNQKTNHRETIKIEYDENIIPLDKILDIYLDNVDVNDSEGQFIDRGHSYTLAIFYTNEIQKEKITLRCGKYQSIEILPYTTFYEAEEYHQDYAIKNVEAFNKELFDSKRTRLEFRKANSNDVEDIIKLINQRIKWMDKENIQQWNKTKYMERYPLVYWGKIIDDILVATLNNQIVALLALFNHDERWNEDKDALYVHHLTSDINFKGSGIELLKYAEVHTKNLGHKYIRLDSAVGNKKLEDIYTSLGYVEVGRCKDREYFGITREKKL